MVTQSRMKADNVFLIHIFLSSPTSTFISSFPQHIKTLCLFTPRVTTSLVPTISKVPYFLLLIISQKTSGSDSLRYEGL